jgi:hypothetical protein
MIPGSPVHFDAAARCRGRPARPWLPQGASGKKSLTLGGFLLDYRLCVKTSENGKLAKMGAYPFSPDSHIPGFRCKALDYLYSCTLLSFCPFIIRSAEDDFLVLRCDSPPRNSRLVR